MYDIIIVGMGISGITAGIYAKRRKMKVLMLDKSNPGGLLNNIDTISNYPGLLNISGPDFSNTLKSQIESLNIEYKKEEVISLELNKIIKIVKTNKHSYKSKKVILALGRKPKYLGLDNEQEYLGKGISTSALKDHKYYQNKTIAVVGSGNSALQETLYLSTIAKKIYLLNRSNTFKAEEELINQIKNNSKVNILYNVTLKKINSINNKINNIILNNNTSLDVEGIFIYIGYRPSTELLNNYPILDKDGYIKVNEDLETPIKNVYAIGDCINKRVFQLVTASSDGAIVILKMKKISH